MSPVKIPKKPGASRSRCPTPCSHPNASVIVYAVESGTTPPDSSEAPNKTTPNTTNPPPAHGGRQGARVIGRLHVGQRGGVELAVEGRRGGDDDEEGHDVGEDGAGD